MNSKKLKTYSKNFKEQILKECIETNNYSAVAKKHKLPATTVYTWIQKYKNKSKLKRSKGQKALEKELADAKLEIDILKEL
ncbi:MAG: transposase [Deltaproteobacteria bacterium]|nr:transposase [Deltaproteobacteria bacterium]